MFDLNCCFVIMGLDLLRRLVKEWRREIPTVPSLPAMPVIWNVWNQ